VEIPVPVNILNERDEDYKELLWKRYHMKEQYQLLKDTKCIMDDLKELYYGEEGVSEF
jgi:hypothetical protein